MGLKRTEGLGRPQGTAPGLQQSKRTMRRSQSSYTLAGKDGHREAGMGCHLQLQGPIFSGEDAQK